MTRWLDRHRYALGFAASVLIVAGGFFYIGQRTRTTQVATARNTNAIRVSCTLLANLVVQATTPRARASSKIIVNEVLLEAEQHGRPEVVIQYRKTLKEAPPFKPPDCEQAAERPASVTPVPIATPTPLPRILGAPHQG